MMLLDNLLSDLRDEHRASAALLQLNDIVLVTRVEEECVRQGEELGEYVAGSVRRFAGQASHDDWLALMNAIGHAANPAGTCLATMLDWSLDRDRAAAPAGCDDGACSCVGGS